MLNKLFSGHSRLLGDAAGDDGGLLHAHPSHSAAAEGHQSTRLLHAQATGNSAA